MTSLTPSRRRRPFSHTWKGPGQSPGALLRTAGGGRPLQSGAARLGGAGAGVLDGGGDGEADLDGSLERVVVLDLPLDGGGVGLTLKLHRDARVEAVVRDGQGFERRVAEPRADACGERAARALEDERRRVLAEGRRHLKIPSPNQIHKSHLPPGGC